MFVLGQLLRPRAMQRLLYRWSAKSTLPDSVCGSYSRHGLRHPAVVRDLARVLRALHPRHTLAAAEALRSFERPALVAWAADDRFFPPDDGRRLAALMPRARFELVEDSYTFIPEDQPERLAALIREFVA
jgi:pimeloyl-ACP methyl ester carboxylesterase